MYGALFNSNYVPNQLEASYLANPIKFLSPYLFGGILAQYFFGVFTCQVVNYYSAFGNSDPLSQKVHVSIVVALTIFKIVQIVISLWKRHVVDWGNFRALTVIEEDTRITSLSTVLVTIAVQVFFIHRCFLLSSRNYFFLVPVVACCLLSLAASLWVTITMPVNFAAKSDSFIKASRLFPAASVATDGLITVFSMYYLVEARRNVASKSTDTLISRMILITLQSALPPLVTASLSAAFTGQTLGPYVFMWHCTTPLLEAFSMMYTLNCRAELRKADTNAHRHEGAADYSTMHWARRSSERLPVESHISLQNVSSVGVSKTIETHGELNEVGRAGENVSWYLAEESKKGGSESATIIETKLHQTAIQ
ncbi:hypothetical protein C8J56DRAFT_958301 [Mycena floridula]|nr:hypothetical protein C8J56DRAFT_958301 [Mycena floridula]